MHKGKLFIIFIFSLWNLQLWSQKWIIVQKEQDSIGFKSSQILITPDTFFISPVDSFVFLQKGEKYRIRSNPFSKSKLFYDSIKVKSYKHQITRELYQIFFKSVPIEVQDTSNFDVRESVYLPYQGKQIRNIKILKVDVIEGSIYDTLIMAHSFWAKSANNLHINTRDHVIYNNLTFKEGDKVIATKLSDNERILRNYSYIEDARIYIEPIPSDTSMVDLLILTKDKFQVGIGFNYSGVDNFQTFLYDKNFLGIGHEMRHYLVYRAGYDPQYGYAFSYKINNILKSFTSLTLNYENSWARKYKAININKDFLTQQTKYAGGLSLYQIATSRDYNINDSIVRIPYEANIQDYWIGRAFPISESNGMTFNTSFRFANANFIKRPFVSADSNYFYHDRSLFLANFSLVRLKYYLSSLVYAFGVTEDIPYGYKLNLMIGYEKDQFFNRPYFNAGFSYGKHFEFPGYLLFDAEFGTYYAKNEFQDRILKFKLLSIGNLYHLNRYSIRNFFDIDFQSGYNMSDPDNKAVINGHWTSIVSGLNKIGLKGQQKITANYESVLFTPWYLFGFKFAMNCDLNLGWVSQENLFKKSDFYGNISLGVRIKNESWIFETITLGVAYFLRAPAGSAYIGLIFDGSDPRVFRNLNPGKPDWVKMDQSPALFLD
jgi:hypothetical protein